MNKSIKRIFCIFLCIIFLPIYYVKGEAIDDLSVLVNCPEIFGESQRYVEQYYGEPDARADPSNDVYWISYDLRVCGGHASMTISFKYDIITSIAFNCTDNTVYSPEDQTVYDFVNDVICDNYNFSGGDEKNAYNLMLNHSVVWGYDIRDIGYGNIREWAGDDDFRTIVFSAQYLNNPKGDFVYVFFPINNILEVRHHK